MSLSSQIKEYCKVKYSSIKVVLDQVEISVERDNLLKLIQFLKVELFTYLNVTKQKELKLNLNHFFT